MQAAYRKLGKRVGPKKSRQQQTHLRDRDSEVVLNEFVRHRQGSSINIIESAPRNEEGDRPALDRTDSRRWSANRRVDSDLLGGLDHVPKCISAELSEVSHNVPKLSGDRSDQLHAPIQDRRGRQRYRKGDGQKAKLSYLGHG